MKNLLWRSLFMPLLFLLLFSTACTGLGGEPEIVATLPPQQVQETEPEAAPINADIANGASIFANRCTDCHGINGNGQGELVLTGQIPEMRPFNQPEAAREQTPQEWFDTITNGRIENLMPPWGDSLSAQQRWDVALYTYTQHYTADQVENGFTTWTRIQNDIADVERFSDFDTMNTLSDQALFDVLTEETDGSLSEDDTWAAVSYLRTLTLANADYIGQASIPPPPASTEEADAPAQASDSDSPTQAAQTTGEDATGSIFGTVGHGTANATLPDELTVLLRFGNPNQGLETLETPLEADGTFRFDGIPIREDFGYIAFTRYQEQVFSSEILIGDTTTSEYDLSFDIYETTNDPGVVQIKSMELFVDGLTVEGLGSGLFVSQLITYENTSDRMYTTDREVGDGRFASLLVLVPPGAMIQNAPDNPRFIVSEEESALIDTQPVYPEQDHHVQVIYFVPYTEGGAIIEQPLLTRAVDAVVRLLIHPQTVEIVSEEWQRTGEETHMERPYALYEGVFNANIDDVFRFEVDGSVLGSASTSQNPAVITSNNLPLVIGLMVVGLLLVGGGIFLARRSNKTGNTEQEIGKLVRQIAELDAMHDEGQINHDVYQRQRADLKAQLAQLMKEKSSEETNQ